MSVMTLLRRWGLAAVLAVTSFGSWQAAQRRDIDDVSVEPVVYQLAPATPLLSARRIPRTLQAPVVDESLRPTIQAAISNSPELSCVVVQVGDRVLQPTSNEATPLIPASNQKLLTTYAALIALGEDFRFRTDVAVDARPVDGVVTGNLYLIGGGDPFLSTEEGGEQYEAAAEDTTAGEDEQSSMLDGRAHTSLEALADEIVAAGVTSITGSVVGDESLFDAARTGPWDGRLIDQKQSGPLSALTVNEGYVDWPVPFPGGFLNRSATDNPPLHAAGALTALLIDRGVAVGTAGGSPTATGVTPDGAEPLTAIESPPLVDIITHINSYSSNIGAELLLKRIAVEVSGQGSTAAGAEAVHSLLAENGIPVEGLVVRDGSGLAEENALTCQVLAAVLADAGPDSALAESLSIGGQRGSLLRRFTDEDPAYGLVLAKTGTLNTVSAMSGYVQSATDPAVELVFAYIANERPAIANEATKAIQAQLVNGLTAYPGPPTIEVLSPLDPVPD